MVERFFNKIKQCRRVATRYDKLAVHALVSLFFRKNSLLRKTVAVEGIELRLDRGKVAVTLTAEGNNQRADTDPILLSIEARLRRAGKGKRLIIRNGAAAEVNESLIELIKEAFTIRNQLLSGSDVKRPCGRSGHNPGVFRLWLVTATLSES